MMLEALIRETRNTSNLLLNVKCPLIHTHLQEMHSEGFR